MAVDECIRAYDEVAQTAFTPKKMRLSFAPPKGAYSATALEVAIKETIRKYCMEPGCVARRTAGQSTAKTCQHGDDARFRSTSCTKTYVLRYKTIPLNRVD